MTKSTRRQAKPHLTPSVPAQSVGAAIGTPPGAIRRLLRSSEALALAILVIASVFATWPMWRDGHATYVDNPAHLAEIHSLAFDAHNGWSNLAYCGYPLGSMHSPIWYGLLTLVARTGTPVEPWYAFMVWLGFIAPALALFQVARRRVPVLGAAFLAYLLMMQRTVLVGLGSATAGMWTSYLGAAGIILLVDRIARPCKTNRDLAKLAAIVAFTALTHLYTLLPMLILGVFHAIRLTLQGGMGVRRLAREAAAGLLGALIASVYWLQPLLVRTYAEIVPNDQSISALLARLLLPVSILESKELPSPQLSWVIDATPMVLLVVLGLLGIVWLRGRQTDVALPGVALLTATAFLLVLASFRELPFLGNYSWRMLYYVRIGLALAAIPFVAFLFQRVRVPQLFVALACMVAVVSGLWFSQALDPFVHRRHSAEMQEIRATWNWLRDNRHPSWGRVYVQGTFGSPTPSLSLRSGHVLALTARESGVEQLGAFYGGMPIRTTSWTTSEFGRVYGRYLTDETRVSEALEVAPFSNATHLLISNPAFAQILEHLGKCEPLFRAGSYAVLGIRGAESNWLYSEQPGVRVVERQTGALQIELEQNYPGGSFLVKEAFHPFWSISGSDATTLHADEVSRLIIVNAGPGPQRFELSYQPPRWPLLASLLGLAGLTLLTFWRRSELPTTA